MANWSDLTKQIQKQAPKEVSQSKFAESIKGGSRMAAGRHPGVKIVSITPIEGVDYAAIEVIWEDAEGYTMPQRIGLFYESDYSKGFLSFLMAITNNAELAHRFSNAAIAEARLFDRLVSCTATINIGLPKEGFKIKNVDGKLTLADIATDTLVEDFGVFETLKELQEHAKEEKYRVDYNRIRYVEPHMEGIRDNQEQIHAILSEIDTSKKVKAVGSDDVGF